MKGKVNDMKTMILANWSKKFFHKPFGCNKPPQKESDYVNTTIETREEEVNYIVEIHKYMRDNCIHWYTNTYDFSNEERVKITVELTKTRDGEGTPSEREVHI